LKPSTVRAATPALKRIKDKYGVAVSFRIIGDENYYCNELETRALPWRAATEIQDLSVMDIGIMPLPNDEWTKGKCGLKGLQYMALGIRALMSPVGVNTEIVQAGINGFLPATEDEWVADLSTLIENSELRNKIGEAGKQTVANKYSVKTWERQYLQYFDQVTVGY
jgi:glycosyltransferase involved in cell wall biosynthesis